MAPFGKVKMIEPLSIQCVETGARALDMAKHSLQPQVKGNLRFGVERAGMCTANQTLWISVPDVEDDALSSHFVF